MSAPTDEELARWRAVAEAATEGPWEQGTVWDWAAEFGDGRCAYCRDSEPVWVGRADINGKRMPAHRHRSQHPWDADHKISAPGGLVAGNYDYEDGGIIEPADTAFVALARTAMPALLDEVERLRRLVAAWATEPVEVPLSGPTVVTRPASNFVVMACPKEHDAVAVRGEGPALVLRLLCGDAVMAERSWAIGSTLRRAEVDQWIRDTLAEHWFEPTEPGQ